MPLQKLQFRPGIVREITSYTNEGGWHDGDRIRFRYGFPESLLGWEKYSDTAFLGTCRALLPWVTLSEDRYVGIGTHLKYYIAEGALYYDITPLRQTTAAGDVTFSAAANTLAANVAAVDETITLTSSTGFPEAGLIKINSEQIRYAQVSGNVLEGLTRGVNGTTAAAHSSTDAVTCATLTVSDTGHDALAGDFVTFSDAVSLGDQITAAVLNQEYEIQTIIDTSTYLVEARAEAALSSITTTSGIEGTPVFATTSDSGNGGSSVVGAYQINTGLDTTLTGTGWGAGTWGRGTWSSAASSLTTGDSLRIWSHDNFGEDLLINVRDGGIYYWDRSGGGLTSRAVALSDLSGASTAPTVEKKVIVSNVDRHVLAFGCDSEVNPGVQDPLLIRFSNQESVTNWKSEATNTAGDLRLGAGSEIITATETRQQILVFTDRALYAMQYLGPPFTFGINLISENITIQGPLTAIAVDDAVFWMGEGRFYMYQGSVQELPCAVRSYVFNDFNTTQAEKTTAALNSENYEIWWFYPSSSSQENDRYVVYNYMEKAWYYGTLARTAWVDRGILSNPLAASTDHYLYNHELGFNDGSTEPASPLNSFISSSPMDMGDGQQFTLIRRMIPDVSFRNSASDTPTVSVTTRVRNFPNSSFLKTVQSSVTDTTEQVNLRLRGRQFSLKVDCDATDVAWRLGSFRYGMQPDGDR
jgi:hypothetical protein